MRMLAVALGGLGAAFFVGGVLSFIFGGCVMESTQAVSGLGPFNGVWSRADYCFFGALLAAVGSGLATSSYFHLKTKKSPQMPAS